MSRSQLDVRRPGLIGDLTHGVVWYASPGTTVPMCDLLAPFQPGQSVLHRFGEQLGVVAKCELSLLFRDANISLSEFFIPQGFFS